MLRYTRACMTRWRGFRPTTDSAERQISQDWRSAETAPTADILLRRLALAKHKMGARSFWCDWHFQHVSHAVYSWNVLDVDDILFAQVSEVYHSRPLRGWIVIHRGGKNSVNGFLCLLLYLIRDIAVSPSAGKTQFLSSIPGKTTCFLLKTNVRKDAK